MSYRRGYGVWGSHGEVDVHGDLSGCNLVSGEEMPSGMGG